MVTVLHNSARSNAAALILMLHMTPLRNVRGSKEYPQKVREANSVVNIEDTGQPTFASKQKHKKMPSSLFPFLLGTSPLLLHSC